MFGSRLFAGSEPPADRMAFDVWKSQPPSNGFATFRTYADVIPLGNIAPGFEPGTGAIYSPPWRYYLVLDSGFAATPTDLRAFRNTFDARIQLWRDVRPLSIARDLAANPKITRIVVWDRIDPARTDVYAPDPLKSLLSQDWRRVSEEVFAARDHWIWQNLFKCRRREYVRLHAG